MINANYKLSALITIFILLFTSKIVAAGVSAETTDNHISRHALSSIGWNEHVIEHDNLKRYFLVYQPKNLRHEPDVVFVLHGGTQSMRKIFYKRAGGSQHWQQIADEEGILLIAPNAVNVESDDTRGDRQNWNDCRLSIAGNGSSSTADDVGFIDKLIHWSHQNYHTNLNRVYVTGASNGGMMAFRLITELGDRFSAAAIFIANQPVKTDCSKAAYMVPMMIMNGTDDPLILWWGGQIRNKGVFLSSAEATLKFWKKVNNISTEASIDKLPDTDKADRSHIIRRKYTAADNTAGSTGSDLWFYEVRGGGHTMPSIEHKTPLFARWLLGNQNKDIEGAKEAWKFLKQYTIKS